MEPGPKLPRAGRALSPVVTARLAARRVPRAHDSVAWATPAGPRSESSLCTSHKAFTGPGRFGQAGRVPLFRLGLDKPCAGFMPCSVMKAARAAAQASPVRRHGASSPRRCHPPTAPVARWAAGRRAEAKRDEGRWAGRWKRRDAAVLGRLGGVAYYGIAVCHPWHMATRGSDSDHHCRLRFESQPPPARRPGLWRLRGRADQPDAESRERSDAPPAMPKDGRDKTSLASSKSYAAVTAAGRATDRAT